MDPRHRDALDCARAPRSLRERARGRRCALDSRSEALAVLLIGAGAAKGWVATAVKLCVGAEPNDPPMVEAIEMLLKQARRRVVSNRSSRDRSPAPAMFM